MTTREEWREAWRASRMSREFYIPGDGMYAIAEHRNHVLDGWLSAEAHRRYCREVLA